MWDIFRDISASIFDVLVNDNNRDASQKNDLSFTVSSSEIKKILGLIVLSACNSRCNFRHY